MTTARAAVLSEHGRPLQVRSLPVPDPEPGALVVAVEAATVCGTDVHLWQHGLPDLREGLPVVPGHEAVGRVLAIGAGAGVDSMGATVREGDRVVWTHGACGHCRPCVLLHRPTLCANRKVGMGRTCERFPHLAGTFAEVSYVWPEAGRVKVPEGIPDAWASAASCALRSAVKCVEEAGRIGPTDTVIVQGAGPLGLFAAALASLQSPRQLILIGGPSARLQVGAQWGATATLDIADHPTPDSRRAAVEELTGGAGGDIVLEMSGAPGAFAETIEIAGLGARCVVAGTVSPSPQSVRAHLITLRALTIVGAFGAEIDAYWKGLQVMARFGERFDVDLLLGGTYGLEEATDALQSMVDEREIKPIIRP